jgi:hypothetical protein
MSHKTVAVLSDVTCDGYPDCHHCGEALPPDAKAQLQGLAVVVTCPYCFCMTPFPLNDTSRFDILAEMKTRTRRPL